MLILQDETKVECARSHHFKTWIETLVFIHANIAEFHFRKLCGTHPAIENLIDPTPHVSWKIQMLQVFEERSDNYNCASVQLGSRKVIPLQSITLFIASSETRSSIIVEYHNDFGFNSQSRKRDGESVIQFSLKYVYYSIAYHWLLLVDRIGLLRSTPLSDRRTACPKTLGLLVPNYVPLAVTESGPLGFRVLLALRTWDDPKIKS